MERFKAGISEEGQKLQDGLAILAKMIVKHHLRKVSGLTDSNSNGEIVSHDSSDENTDKTE